MITRALWLTAAAAFVLALLPQPAESSYCVRSNGWPEVGGTLDCIFDDGTICSFLSTPGGVKGTCIQPV